MKTILLTGAQGFTGTYLIPALEARGYTVHGLVIDKPKRANEHAVDINQARPLREVIEKIQPDYLIHLAAISYVPHTKIADFYQTNVIGTLNLLQAFDALNLHPKKMVFASSANVYGQANQNPITETEIPRPMNHYSSSKLAMENMLRLWFDRFPILITRPFNYTGIGQASCFLTPKIVEHFQDKKSEIELGNLAVVRDFSDVHFVIESYLRLLESEIQGDIFNICSGQGHSIQALIDHLEEISDHRIQVKSSPALMRPNEIMSLIGSNHKLLQSIGNISHASIREILSRMYHHSTLAIETDAGQT